MSFLKSLVIVVGFSFGFNAFAAGEICAEWFLVEEDGKFYWSGKEFGGDPETCSDPQPVWIYCESYEAISSEHMCPTAFSVPCDSLPWPTGCDIYFGKRK